MTQDALSELTVPGTLRVGITLGNILLVTGTSLTGDPQGVAPDMAAAIAERLGVAVSYATFDTPGEVADAVEWDEWDIGLIAMEPKRAENSPLQSIEDVDRPGVRIAVSDRAAYDLYLTRTLKHAELRRAKGLRGAFELFVTEKLDALAGLVPALKENSENLPGSRVMDGRYTSVRQAVGTKPETAALNALVEQFIAEAKESELVAKLIEKHGVKGKLQVASGS